MHTVPCAPHVIGTPALSVSDTVSHLAYGWPCTADVISVEDCRSGLLSVEDCRSGPHR